MPSVAWLGTPLSAGDDIATLIAVDKIRRGLGATQTDPAIFVLMATRPPGEEGLEFFRSRLGWLYDAEPETLDPPFAGLQRELFGVVRG